MPRNLNRRTLEELIRWYGQRTKKSPHRTTTYELTLEALNFLHRAESTGCLPAFERPNVDVEDEDSPIKISEPIKLTERQAHLLALIKTQRFMVNPSTAGNKKLIASLIEAGVLSEWREVTEKGHHALLLSGFGAAPDAK